MTDKDTIIIWMLVPLIAVTTLWVLTFLQLNRIMKLCNECVEGWKESNKQNAMLRQILRIKNEEIN